MRLPDFENGHRIKMNQKFFLKYCWFNDRVVFVLKLGLKFRFQSLT